MVKLLKFGQPQLSRIARDQDKICVLVLMGVDTNGHKHLISLEDGVRDYVRNHLARK